MFTRFCLFLFASFLFLQGNISAHYIVKTTPLPIVIDGIFNEKAWNACDSIILKDCTTGASPVQWTKAMAVWDTQNLYLGIRTQDTDVWSSSAQRDGSLYKDEVIEFFLDPDCDGKNYFEFEFNCLNALMDIFMTAPWGTAGGGGDLSWNCTNIAFKTVVHGTANNPGDVDTGITLEIKIPWTDLKNGSYSATRPHNGDSCAVNIYRIDGRDSLHKTFSCMSPVGGVLPGSFHSPQKFASFKFSDSLAQSPVRVVRERSRCLPGRETGLSCSHSHGKSIIRYSLSSPSIVVLSVVTLQGVCIRQFCAASIQQGTHVQTWDNTDLQGRTIAHGLYFVVLSQFGQPQELSILTIE